MKSREEFGGKIRTYGIKKKFIQTVIRKLGG